MNIACLDWLCQRRLLQFQQVRRARFATLHRERIFCREPDWRFHANALITLPRPLSVRRTTIEGTPMSTTSGDPRPASGLVSWRTPLVIIACGCLVGMLSFGPRSSLGFFVQPMSREFAWGRDVCGLALAIPEPAVGPWSALSRAPSPTSFRDFSASCASARCLLYVRRPVTTMRCTRQPALVARSRRRCSDRPRIVRLLVQPRAVSVQQAVACRAARRCVGPGDRSQLIRTVPVRTVRGSR